MPSGPQTEPPKPEVIDARAKAEAAHAARRSKVTRRAGVLDDRLFRCPEGWWHRLALIEAANLRWLSGVQMSLDRLVLWISMRLSDAHDDPNALAGLGECLSPDS